MLNNVVLSFDNAKVQLFFDMDKYLRDFNLML